MFIALLTTLAPIYVQENSIRSRNETVASSHIVSTEKETSDERVDQLLSKVPGMNTRNTAGSGSLTTATLPQALDSGSTAVAIDSIPIPNPAGIGISLALIPSSLLSGADYLSPFYSLENPNSIQVPSQGGRLRLRTQTLAFQPQSKRMRAGLRVGSAHSANAFGLIENNYEKNGYLLGVDFQTAKGDFSYTEPSSGVSKVRENNSSASGSGLFKFRQKTSDKGQIEFSTLYTKLEKTNPGSLSFPERSHETDQLAVAGVAYGDAELINKKTGFFSGISSSYGRVQNMYSIESQTDAHTFGSIAQTGVVHRFTAGNASTFADGNYESFNSDQGKFYRSTLGLSQTVERTIADYKIVPKIRYEHSKAFGHVADGLISAEYQPQSIPQLGLVLAYGYQHNYPAILAQSGFRASGLVVLPNPELKLERNSNLSAEAHWTSEDWSLSESAFVTVIQNRAAFTSAGTAFQYQNVPHAMLTGSTTEAQFSVLSWLRLRSNATISRSWNRDTGREFPYKPRFFGSSALVAQLSKSTNFTTEEKYQSKRLINFTDTQSISPFAQTDVTLNHAWSERTLAYFKVSNLFGEGAFATDGFPIEGRIFSLGLQVEGF